MESFEAIVENLVNQENFTRIKVVGDDVTLVGERVGGLVLPHTYSMFNSKIGDSLYKVILYAMCP